MLGSLCPYVCVCVCVLYIHVCVCVLPQSVLHMCTCESGFLGYLFGCVCGSILALQRFNIRQCLPPAHLFYSSCLPQCRVVCSSAVDSLSFFVFASEASNV